MPRSPADTDPFTALAEPRRRAILEALLEGEQTVNELVDGLAIPQPQVSKHLAVLRSVELVAVRREGRQRHYRIDPEGLQQVRRWLSRFERLWNGRLDRLDDLLHELQSARGPNPPPAKEQP